MHEIKTHVDIAADAATVWRIISDFGAYGLWNPLIRGVLGKPHEGRTIEIRVRSGAGPDLRQRERIVRVREYREMHWLERAGVPGIRSLERRFRIELRPHGVRFHHSETHGGMMNSLPLRRTNAPHRNSMEDMNRALKVRAEGVGNNVAARA